MSHNYLIADTSFQMNLRYDPYLRFKSFISENIIPAGKLEIRFGDTGLFEDRYLEIEDRIEWYLDESSNLSVRVVDKDKKIVIGNMVFNDNYKSANILHRYFDKLSRDNYLDYFLLAFFQINLLMIPGISLHASAINWKDQGILFSAQSGTGKSTQARLWSENENVEIINGDRPAITLRQDGFYVHGTPWSGRDPIFKNISRPVKAIIMLEQSPDNLIERISPKEAVSLLLPRVFMPYFDEYLTAKALDIVDQIIQKVPIYKLKCRPDVGAVEVLKKELSLLRE